MSVPSRFRQDKHVLMSELDGRLKALLDRASSIASKLPVEAGVVALEPFVVPRSVVYVQEAPVVNPLPFSANLREIENVLNNEVVLPPDKVCVDDPVTSSTKSYRSKNTQTEQDTSSASEQPKKRQSRLLSLNDPGNSHNTSDNLLVLEPNGADVQNEMLRHELAQKEELFEQMQYRENALNQKMKIQRTELEELQVKEKKMELVDVAALYQDIEFFKRERAYLYSKVCGFEASFEQEREQDEKAPQTNAKDLVKQSAKDLIRLQCTLHKVRNKRRLDYYKYCGILASYEKCFMKLNDETFASKEPEGTVSHVAPAKLDIKLPESTNTVMQIVKSFYVAVQNAFSQNEQAKTLAFESVLRYEQHPTTGKDIKSCQDACRNISAKLARKVLICTELLQTELNKDHVDIGVQAEEKRIVPVKVEVNSIACCTDDLLPPPESPKNPAQTATADKEPELVKEHEEKEKEKMEEALEKEKETKLLGLKLTSNEESLRESNARISELNIELDILKGHNENLIAELQARDEREKSLEEEIEELETKVMIAEAQAADMHTSEPPSPSALTGNAAQAASSTSKTPSTLKNNAMDLLTSKIAKLQNALRSKLKEVEGRSLALHHVVFRFCNKLRAELQVPSYLLTPVKPHVVNKDKDGDNLSAVDAQRGYRILEVIAQDEAMLLQYMNIIQNATGNKVSHLREAVFNVKVDDLAEDDQECKEGAKNALVSSRRSSPSTPVSTRSRSSLAAKNQRNTQSNQTAPKSMGQGISTGQGQGTTGTEEQKAAYSDQNPMGLDSSTAEERATEMTVIERLTAKSKSSDGVKKSFLRKLSRKVSTARKSVLFTPKYELEKEHGEKTSAQTLQGNTSISGKSFLPRVKQEESLRPPQLDVGQNDNTDGELLTPITQKDGDEFSVQQSFEPFIGTTIQTEEGKPSEDSPKVAVQGMDGFPDISMPVVPVQPKAPRRQLPDLRSIAMSLSVTPSNLLPVATAAQRTASRQERLSKAPPQVKNMLKAFSSLARRSASNVVLPKLQQ
eukprot:TRINITY_DN9455_c0_g1_i1.p1 TRINITY_DN9455_c0_g1~~TRINITY_DN9455_c0_g1_i1.p1  ORF type:complete len:1025 (+),score=207.56 TRINITY_DN9455_c0_g1_i1:50-3124(+)